MAGVIKAVQAAAQALQGLPVYAMGISSGGSLALQVGAACAGRACVPWLAMGNRLGSLLLQLPETSIPGTWAGLAWAVLPLLLLLPPPPPLLLAPPHRLKGQPPLPSPPLQLARIMDIAGAVPIVIGKGNAEWGASKLK